MPIPSPCLRVHGILGKDCVEHVCGVDLGGEIAIVASIVATDQVAEGGLAIAPVAFEMLVTLCIARVINLLGHPERFRTFQAGDLSSQLIVEFGDLHLYCRLMSFWSVNFHVEGAEVKLAQIEQCIVDVLCLDKLVN